ncbi:MAG: sensory rhodopsin transducer [Actinomycetota bacterium]|nr:sensory rhodopsin transducer [Actinomycetota bacterium]
MEQGEGKRIWLFPDGELPVPDPGSTLAAHEALMVLNTSGRDASLKLSFYFEDREPEENIKLAVKAKRVKCIRMDDPVQLGGFKLPYSTQYALRVESNIPVTATFGRLDTASDRMAFYTSAWHCY